MIACIPTESSRITYAAMWTRLQRADNTEASASCFSIINRGKHWDTAANYCLTSHMVHSTDASDAEGAGSSLTGRKCCHRTSRNCFQRECEKCKRFHTCHKSRTMRELTEGHGEEAGSFPCQIRILYLVYSALYMYVMYMTETKPNHSAADRRCQRAESLVLDDFTQNSGRSAP